MLCVYKASATLFCGAASGNLHVIDLHAGKEIRNIEAHTLGIYDIKIHHNQLITCGGDGAVKVWSLPDLKLLHHHQESTKSGRCIAINQPQNIMAVGFSDYKIRIYQLSDYTLLNTLNAHTNSVFTVAFIPDGHELLSGGRDVMLRSWVVNENYRLDLDVPAHTLHINHIAFNPSGKLFATVSMDKTIKIWETEKFQLLKVIDKAKLDGHLSSVNKCHWVDDETLLTGSDDKTMMMWKIDVKK
jgi:WD40 repeat protein